MKKLTLIFICSSFLICCSTSKTNPAQEFVSDDTEKIELKTPLFIEIDSKLKDAEFYFSDDLESRILEHFGSNIQIVEDFEHGQSGFASIVITKAISKSEFENRWFDHDDVKNRVNIAALDVANDWGLELANVVKSQNLLIENISIANKWVGSSELSLKLYSAKNNVSMVPLLTEVLVSNSNNKEANRKANSEALSKNQTQLIEMISACISKLKKDESRKNANSVSIHKNF